MLLSVSTINSMDDVLCSAIVTERLKMRKSLPINYWQDTTSVVEIKSNGRNVKNLWGVSTSFEFCVIFHFKTIFFNSWKIQVSKNLRGAAPSPPLAPSAPPVSTGLRTKIVFRASKKRLKDVIILERTGKLGRLKKHSFYVAYWLRS